MGKKWITWAGLAIGVAGYAITWAQGHHLGGSELSAFAVLVAAVGKALGEETES